MPEPAPKPVLDASKRGKRAKRKGYRLEVEFADKVGGQVVRLSGARGGDKDSNDVIQPELGQDWRYEIKGRASGLKTLYGWLQRQMGCGVDAVAYTPAATPITDGGKGRMRPPQAVGFRADNSNWLVVIPLDEWRHVLNRLANAEREAQSNWVGRAIEHLQRVGRGAS